MYVAMFSIRNEIRMIYIVNVYVYMKHKHFQVMKLQVELVNPCMFVITYVNCFSGPDGKCIVA
jgi:hypothetical protein